MMSSPESIPWCEWGAEAFARASREQKPVLLSIGAAWCQWTAEMARVSYRDIRVLQLVAERFVPVRVDADRRPDVSERYTLEGWPTTVFLTPDGEMLGGGTYLEPGPLAVVLEQVADAFAVQRDQLPVRLEEIRAKERVEFKPRSLTQVDSDDEGWRWLEEQLLGRFDPDWAGFGIGPKKVEAEALAIGVLRCGETKNDEIAKVVTLTLDAIASGSLWDPVDGGFFRYCAGRDWTEPQVEKVLTANAQLLELYLLASQVFMRPDYADRARAVILFVHKTFADSEGGFFASQRTDSQIGNLSSEERGHMASLLVDHTVYTDATAVMASAYILGASILNDESLLEFAAEAVDRVVMETYQPGGGLGHNATGTPAPRGLLTDQVMMSSTLLDLYEVTGQAVYLDLPRELMAYCRQKMWHDTAGFADRARNLPGSDASIGLLREPRYPLALNCRAAIVQARLGKYADDPAYMDLATQTLTCQASVYRKHGLAGAAYLLALHRIRAVTDT